MKRFTIYRSMRGQAQILGLTVNAFAIQMIAVVGSLLMIIFSFNLLLVLVVTSSNIGLYFFLIWFKNLPQLSPGRSPRIISNKQIGISSYEN